MSRGKNRGLYDDNGDNTCDDDDDADDYDDDAYPDNGDDEDNDDHYDGENDDNDTDGNDGDDDGDDVIMRYAASGAPLYKQDVYRSLEKSAICCSPSAALQAVCVPSLRKRCTSSSRTYDMQ